jgi:RNA polymerase sigma-70 factor (ECF subfamily)
LPTQADFVPEEQQILLRLANGDLKAFDSIYLKYADLLLAQTTKITKDRFVAEDIIQDVFVRLWERRSEFATYQKISGWLFLSTFNASMNYLKKVARESKRHEAFEQNRIDPDINDLAKQEAQHALIEVAIHQLPPQRKQVFTLCKYEGMTYDDVAAKLSISKNTVKDHLKKANESIKNYILQEKDQALAVAAILAFYKYF